MYGKLTVITGSMFAGKTSRLIQESKRKSTIVFKPAMDTRYSENECVSHDGVAIPAISVSIPEDVSIASEYDIVLFDEVQFFVSPHYSDDISETIRILLASGKSVMVAGLDMDWRGKPFDVTSRLLGMADTVIKLTARCEICQAPANKTYKKVDSGTEFDLGHSDKYEARCNIHWSPEN